MLESRRFLLPQGLNHSTREFSDQPHGIFLTEMIANMVAEPGNTQSNAEADTIAHPAIDHSALAQRNVRKHEEKLVVHPTEHVGYSRLIAVVSRAGNPRILLW